MPSVPTSLYRYYDKRNILLYVGITSRGVRRNSEHNLDKPWWPYVHRQEVEHFPSREDALVAETTAIRRWSPPFNVQHNDLHRDMRAAYAWVQEWGSVASDQPRTAELEEFIHPVLPNLTFRFDLAATPTLHPLVGQAARVAGVGVKGAPRAQIEWLGPFLVVVAGPHRHNLHASSAEAHIRWSPSPTLRSVQLAA